MNTFKQHTWRLLSFIIIPLTIWLTIFNIYTIYDISKENHAQIYHDRLSLISRQIEDELTQTADIMSPLINDTGFIMFGYRNLTETLFNTSQKLITTLEPAFTMNGAITGILLYSRPNDYYRPMIREYINQDSFLQYIKGIDVRKNTSLKGWTIAEIDHTRYLIHILNSNGAYLMCFVNVNAILQTALEHVHNEGYIAVMSDEDLIFGDNRISLSKDELTRLHNKNKLVIKRDDSYILVKQASSYLGYDLVYASSYHFTIQPVQIILIIVSILLLCILIPFGVVRFRKTFLVPLNELSDSMTTIKEGNLEERFHVNSQIIEYQQLSQTLNEMLEQIHSLKISSYEKTLESQKIELEYRSMQIRPHFFLNCLKTLYSLAECRDYQSLQQYILSFSGYFRGIFGNTQMLTIQDELSLVKNYVALQTNSANTAITYKEEIDPDTVTLPIPSLTILTFVENSIKYGRRIHTTLDLCVHVKLIPDPEKSYLNITISDNGPGFNAEELKQLNSNTDPENTNGTHIGITNIKKRCHLIYGDEASITFIQADGAYIEMFLPIQSSKEA